MEELALSLLENQIAGYEPTVNRYGSQTRKHLNTMMSEITLLRLQKIEAQKKEANLCLELGLPNTLRSSSWCCD